MEWRVYEVHITGAKLRQKLIAACILAVLCYSSNSMIGN